MRNLRRSIGSHAMATSHTPVGILYLVVTGTTTTTTRTRWSVSASRMMGRTGTNKLRVTGIIVVLLQMASNGILAFPPSGAPRDMSRPGLHRTRFAAASKITTTTSTPTTLPRLAVPTPEESAQQLTDYMAKAHEEKIRAIQDVESKSHERIRQLQNKVDQLEGRAPVPNGAANTNSFDMPATNKQLAQKIQDYRDFLSKYIVQSQIQRVDAVAEAQARLRDHYEEVIADLKKKSKEEPRSVEPEILTKKSFE